MPHFYCITQLTWLSDSICDFPLLTSHMKQGQRAVPSTDVLWDPRNLPLLPAFTCDHSPCTKHFKHTPASGKWEVCWSLFSRLLQSSSLLPQAGNTANIFHSLNHSARSHAPGLMLWFITFMFIASLLPLLQEFHEAKTLVVTGFPLISREDLTQSRYPKTYVNETLPVNYFMSIESSSIVTMD